MALLEESNSVVICFLLLFMIKKFLKQNLFGQPLFNERKKLTAEHCQ